jgi:hypothetical protein
MMMAPDVMARGAARGGMRGAVVGGMAGGSEGAKKGAKVGVVAGATRGAVERRSERNSTTSSTQYESSTNFNESPPDILDSSSEGSAKPGETATLRQDGKPVVEITYPSDWKQKEGDRGISAVSKDGHAWSGLALLEKAKDKQSGVKQVKQSLEKYLKNIDYDDLTKTERGALVVTGTGTIKKSGNDIVFAVGVFDAGKGQPAGIAFIADEKLDDVYKDAARDICETIRTGKDLATEHKVAKPITDK